MKNPKFTVNVRNYAKDNLDKIYNEDKNAKINEKSLSNRRNRKEHICQTMKVYY